MSDARIVRFFSLALVLAASLYSVALCWLNTHGWPMSNATVAATDAAIVVAALALACMANASTTVLPLIAIAINFLVIAFFAPSIELKSARDALVLLAFLSLGIGAGNIRVAQFAFFAVAACVLALGLFELLAPRLYATNLNVLQFYIMRGTIDPKVREWVDTSLFVSSMRAGERNLIAFLGPHRVSSIFLEPVSMGNFGAIAIAWALSVGRKHWRTALAAVLIGASAIVAADARFAVVAVLVFLVARLVPHDWNRILLTVAPLGAIGVLFAMGSRHLIGDDLPSRLSVSGAAIAALSPAELLGLASGGQGTLDSGYAYALSAFGLPLCVALWIAFVWLPTPGAQSTRLKMLIGCYICTLLCISGSSLFALKTAALAWFLLGAMIAEETVRTPAPSLIRGPRPEWREGFA
ncbi:MAG: hypothetical protein ABUS57_00920 [Pseudomonadota bacterium]